MNRSWIHIFASISLICIGGAGCLPIDQIPYERETSNRPADIAVWNEIRPGIDFISKTVTSPTSTQTLSIYRINPSLYSFRFAEDRTPHSIANWAEREPDAVLIANGVYFLENNAPAGLFIVDGKQTSDRQYDWDLSAFITLSPIPEIFDTAQSNINIESYTEAAQTYPFLIKNGRAAVQKDSGLKARRTFLGIDITNNIYIGVVSGGSSAHHLSLYEFQQELLSLPVQWRHVVNLDGGPSTGLFFKRPAPAETDHLIQSQAPVPNIIVVEPKTK